MHDFSELSEPAAAGSILRVDEVINKTSLASGGTMEKRIAYLFIAME